MVGSTLSHYTIEALIGQGGMGTVYRARDTHLNRTVAIKVLSRTDAAAATRTAYLPIDAPGASAAMPGLSIENSQDSAIA